MHRMGDRRCIKGCLYIKQTEVQMEQRCRQGRSRKCHINSPGIVPAFLASRWEICDGSPLAEQLGGIRVPPSGFMASFLTLAWYLAMNLQEDDPEAKVCV